MKTTRLQLLGISLSLFAFASCQRDVKDLPTSVNQVSNSQESGKNEAGVQNSSTPAYIVHLIEANVPVGPNQYRWRWTVQNSNPGNGNGGTIQGLSHWGFSPSLGGCFSASSIVSGAYSSNGTTWTSFTPGIGPDPSQSCSTGSVLKFDFGTSGSALSYFQLILNAPKGVGQANGFYKSGRKTGCGTFTFQGINCAGTPQIIGGGVPNGS
jgi:hypothetical protein